MFYKVGTLLNIKGLSGKVIGYIKYANIQDNGNVWYEYRLKTSRGECWLSCDDVYKEYSISWPANEVRGKIGPEWHEVDKGVQVVKQSDGDVDVDYGERASFVEYEDVSEMKTLSVEIWSDGTEFSKGEYIEPTDIVVMGWEKPSLASTSKGRSAILTACIVIFVLIGNFGGFISAFIGTNKSISKYLSQSTFYTYETSITGNEKQKADVYAYYYNTTTDEVAKDIIQGIEGYTESVTQKDELENQDIAILTKKEYCLVYHPEDDAGKVLVQISNRKYNYTSDNAPYRSSSVSSSWYRSHYYSASYSKDSTSYKSTPSAYSSYTGTTIHNIGNGYFDSYSSSIKQASINSRKSSSGGISSGK